MARLIHDRDPFLYGLENLLEDDDWGFLFSYSIKPPSDDEKELEKHFPEMYKEMKKAFSKSSKGKLDHIDRFEK